MSEKDLFDLLRTIHIGQEQTAIDVAFDHFEESVSFKVTPPFILYRTNDIECFKADDKTYYQENHYIVDLVTDNRNLTLETQVETLFNNNNIPYDKEQDYINDERIYQTRYLI